MLSDLVKLLRLSSHSYGQLVLGAPFALKLPSEVGHFFIVLDGRCELRLGDDAPLQLRMGDFAFLPTRSSVSLVSEGNTAAARSFNGEEGRSYMERGRIDLDGDLTGGVHLVSGCFEFLPDETQFLKFLFDGPLISRMTVGGGTAASVSIFQLIAEEAREMLPGSFNIMDRLSEVLLIQAFRRRLEDPEQSNLGWLRALRDIKIGKALSAMHCEPGQDWSVAKLAELCGMSRSAFADYFRKLVGASPMEHLAWWRMQKAAIMLTNSPAVPLSRIVSTLGYRSEAAFRRKFLMLMGTTPASYRQAKQTRA